MHVADLRIFLAAVAAGSLSAAARQLDLAPMQVSRRLAVLEEELGARLLQRTTRSLSLTAEGEALLPYAAAMVEAEDGARAVLQPVSGTMTGAVTGTLRLTAPSVFGQDIVLPLLNQLLQQHPALQVELDVSDQVVDIVGRGLDLALRIATLQDSEMVARRIAGNPRVLVASPSYLQRRGVPSTLASLSQHDCIGLASVPRWPVLVDGQLQRVGIKARLITSSVGAARAAAVQGLGLSMLTYWDVHKQLDTGQLQLVALQDGAMEQLSVWAVMPSRRFLPPRVRLFLDALQAGLAPSPAQPSAG